VSPIFLKTGLLDVAQGLQDTLISVKKKKKFFSFLFVKAIRRVFTNPVTFLLS